ncbi:unnamed protein product, partial [Coregonus sp. 'balchen']
LTRDSPQYVLRRYHYSEGSNSDEFKKRVFVTGFSMFDKAQKEEETRISSCHHGLAISERFYSSPIDLTVADMGPWLRNVLILAACCYECRGEDSVIQSAGDVTTTEGEQVILGCTFYAVDTSNLYLFWYKHELNGFPKFMLGRFPFGGKNATEFKERFDAHLDKDSKSVPLTIQRVQLSDSAVYYCALKPTVTTGYTAPLQKLFDKCRGDSVSQPKQDETAIEGGQITLACHYETDDPSPYLFWYKQATNDYPKYMLMRFNFGTGDNATDFKERFHADLDANSKSVPLTIQRVQLSDSAVYYCALRPTVTTGYTAPLQKHTELHNDNTPMSLDQGILMIDSNGDLMPI